MSIYDEAKKFREIMESGEKIKRVGYGQFITESAPPVRQNVVKDYVSKFDQKMKGSTPQTAKGWVDGTGTATSDAEKQEIWGQISSKHGYKQEESDEDKEGKLLPLPSFAELGMKKNTRLQHPAPGKEEWINSEGFNPDVVNKVIDLFKHNGWKAIEKKKLFASEFLYKFQKNECLAGMRVLVKTEWKEKVVYLQIYNGKSKYSMESIQEDDTAITGNMVPTNKNIAAVFTGPKGNVKLTGDWDAKAGLFGVEDDMVSAIARCAALGDKTTIIIMNKTYNVVTVCKWSSVAYKVMIKVDLKSAQVPAANPAGQRLV